jgi:hypothetical protein
MIEGISGVFGRINEIHQRVEEIRGLGKNPVIHSLQPNSKTEEKENSSGEPKFSEVLKEVLKENGQLPGQENLTSSELNKVNTLIGSNKESKELLEALYKKLYSKEKSKDISETIKSAAEATGLDASLIKAVIAQESEFNKNATSSKGAMGLMQLMPKTAEILGVDDPYDVEENVLGGARYLKMLMNKYNNDLNLSLAAYNAGPNAVDKYGSVPPYEETQDYVSKVLKYYNEFKNFE